MNKSKITHLLFSIFFLLVFQGCIGKVSWVERKGGDPEQLNWVPVCPQCKEVVDYEALQCKNPSCRILLTWSDKVIYSQLDYSKIPDEQPQGEKPPEDQAPVKPKEEKTSKPKEEEKDIWEEENRLPSQPKEKQSSSDSEKERAPSSESKKAEKDKKETEEWDLEDSPW